MKKVEGNIPIDKSKLNKYINAKDLFIKEYNKSLKSKENIRIMNNKIKDLNDIELSKLTLTNSKKLAIELFNNYSNKNIFLNNKNKIIVNNEDIRESIAKIYSDKRQKCYLKEHLLIFTNLGLVIEKGILVSQNYEIKNRKNYNSWNYYVENVKINDKLFLLEFDVVSRSDDENHYRMHRLAILNKKASPPTVPTVETTEVTALEALASSDNNISQT